MRGSRPCLPVPGPPPPPVNAERDKLGWRHVALLLFAAVLGGLAYRIRVRTADERSVRGVIEALARDAEQGDVADFADRVSRSYHDERGLSRDALLRAFGEYLKARPWSEVRPVRVIVRQVRGERAEASAKVLLAASDRRHRGTEAYRIDLVLSRERGEWRVLSAEDWPVPEADAVPSRL